MSAPVRPLRKVNSSRFAGVATPSVTMAAYAAETTTVATLAAMRNFRRSMTSASAPAGTAPRNIGSVEATCTNDTTRGDGSRLVISQLEAALDIQPPILEITVTVQRTLNAACRNGLHADVAGSGFAVLGSPLMGRPIVPSHERPVYETHTG